MIRTFVPAVFATAILASATVSAEPASTTTSTSPSGPNTAGRRLAVQTPVEAFTPLVQGAVISQTLYLERCIGGCTITGGGINDARSMTSTIPNPGTYNVTEYQNAAGEIGTAADAEWGMFVQCMREVYSPFAVMVTDVKPVAGLSYHLALAAGNPPDVGLPNSILGVAPLAGNCAAFDNVISFSFANHHNQTDVQDRVNNLCWTASQESAHAFGLDHEFAFQDGRSACNDPMTYRTDCGGQKFFRNETASCGENESRPCMCGANQNSHLKLQSVFGPGTSITGVPNVNVTTPAASSAAANSLPTNVIATAGAKRGIAKVELYLNGFRWAEAKGAPFGQNGQVNPSSYGMLVPGAVPNSVVDVVARAYDDLGGFTESAVVTVTKGPAGGCASADSCATGQKCEAGKCFWDPPVGEVGDECGFSQFCISGICQGTADQQICTQNCIVGVADSCPEGLACVAQGNGGICFFSEDEGGGCCSTSDASAPWAPFGFAALVLGFMAFKRRRN